MFQGPLLPILITCMDKESHAQENVEWNYLSIPKLIGPSIFLINRGLAQNIDLEPALLSVYTAAWFRICGFFRGPSAKYPVVYFDNHALYLAHESCSFCCLFVCTSERKADMYRLFNSVIEAVSHMQQIYNAKWFGQLINRKYRLKNYPYLRAPVCIL